MVCILGIYDCGYFLGSQLFIIILNLMLKSYFLKREFFITNHADQIKDHFEFIKEIGRGAYGIVYQAKQKIFPYQTRVIKRISKKKVQNPTNLFNQIKVMTNLDHPHIIKLYETFEDQNSLYLVLDFCEGGELYGRLAHQETFSEGRARYIFKQMVNALRYMHAQKIAHRDLKLQNFLMKNQSSWDIMLIDFGLSFKWNQPMKQQVFEAEKGRVIGTPYYISPEILTGGYSQLCDVWSLGVVLYMLVTGTPPFDGLSDKMILENVKKYNYSLKTQQCQNLSSRLLDLLGNIFKPESERLSMEGILKHAWMAQAQPFNDVLLSLQYTRIRQFSRFTKLKKIVATYIATQMSDGQIQQICDIFKQIDFDSDGFITVEELYTFLTVSEGQSVAMSDLKKLVNSIDTDRNGKINYNEFIAICIDEAIIHNDDYLRFVFNAFDLNHDGMIQRQEFQLILKVYSKDFKCNQKLVDQIINEHDKNKDGVIDFGEFKSAMSGFKQKLTKHQLDL